MIMPTATINVTVDLVTEICYQCSMAFAMPAQFQRERRRDKGSFYCPMGHYQAYLKSEADELRANLTRARDEAERAQRATAEWRDTYAREKARHSATKGQLTKARKWIQEGVCTECSQKFPDLEVHMKTEHPYAAADDPEVRDA